MTSDAIRAEDEELRAAEEFRKRSIANIYKQLARVLHPDFERDSERQKEKVQLDAGTHRSISSK